MILVLCDLCRTDQLANSCVGWGVWVHLRLCLFDRLAEREQSRQCCCCLGCVGVSWSDLLDAQMQRAEIADAGDEGCVLGHGKLQAVDADVAAVGEGKADVADRPYTRKCRHFAVTG